MTTFEDWLKHTGYQHFAMQPAEVVRRALHMAWQASRENQQEYQKHEFCRGVKCPDFLNGKCWAKNDDVSCIMTAKEFHHWLKENGYRIVRGDVCITKKEG